MSNSNEPRKRYSPYSVNVPDLPPTPTLAGDRKRATQGEAHYLEPIPPGAVRRQRSTEGSIVKQQSHGRGSGPMTIDPDDRHWFLQNMEFIYMQLSEPHLNIFAKLISVFILSCILASVVLLVMETLPQNKAPQYTGPGAQPKLILETDNAIMVIFTIEYVLRIITVPGTRLKYVLLQPEPKHMEEHEQLLKKAEAWDPLTLTSWKVWMWVKQPLNMVDLVSIFPYVVKILIGDIGADTAFVRVLRLARVFRVMKLSKHTVAIALFSRVLTKSSGPLMLLLFFLLLCVVVFGSLVYFFEAGEYHKVGKFSGNYMRVNAFGDGIEKSPFTTMLQAFWWVFETITTVGYGDISPTTVGGKLMGVVCMIMGVIGFSMPITVISNSFRMEFEALEKLRKRRKAEEEGRVNHASRCEGLTIIERLLQYHDDVGLHLLELRDTLKEVNNDRDQLLAQVQKLTDTLNTPRANSRDIHIRITDPGNGSTVVTASGGDKSVEMTRVMDP